MKPKRRQKSPETLNMMNQRAIKTIIFPKRKIKRTLIKVHDTHTHIKPTTAFLKFEGTAVSLDLKIKKRKKEKFLSEENAFLLIFNLFFVQ